MSDDFLRTQLRQAQDALTTAERLRAAKDAGLANLDAIVASQKVLPRRLARRYLTENIHYDFGNEELFGFQVFNRLCVEVGLASKEVEVEFCG